MTTTQTEKLSVESICPQKADIVYPLLKTGPLTIEKISYQVGDFYNVPVSRMQAKTRKREVVIARQLSMYFTKWFTANSLKTIGEFFGARDHTTVIHSLRTVQDLLDTDPVYKEQVKTLRAMIW